MNTIQEFSLELISRLSVVLDKDTLNDVKDVITSLVKEVNSNEVDRESI